MRSIGPSDFKRIIAEKAEIIAPETSKTAHWERRGKLITDIIGSVCEESNPACWSQMKLGKNIFPEAFKPISY